MRCSRLVKLERPQRIAVFFCGLVAVLAISIRFDPKRQSTGRKDPGSYYPSVDTAIAGVRLCEHLSRTAKLLDRCAVIRTLNHNVVDEHAAATNRVHTGRPPADSTVYPSIGSIVSHKLGANGDGVPAYVVAGYPSASRGPGFLGAKHSYVYLTDTELGPAGLRRPTGLSDARFDRRNALACEASKRLCREECRR